MPYDSEGNWITLEESERNLPAVRPPASQSLPDYLTDVNQSPEQLQDTREDALRKAQAVLQFLHRFNASSNTLWGGVYGGVYGADTEDAPENWWEGVKGGINTARGIPSPDINLSEVLKMQQPTKDMSWLSSYDTETGKYTPGWLGTAGKKLAVDLGGDPLTYLFAPAKAAGMLPRAVRAAFPFLKEGQSLGGKALEVSRIPQIAENLSLKSGLNKAFGHEPATETAKAAMGASRREMNVTTQEARDLAAQGEAKTMELIKPEPTMPGAPQEFETRPVKEQMLDIFHGTERPAEWPKDVPPEVADYIDPLMTMRDEVFQRLNATRQRLGYKPIENLSTDDYNQVLHQFFGRGPQETGEEILARMKGWVVGKPKSRELGKFVKPGTGEDMMPGIVSSRDPQYLERLGIKETPEGGFAYKDQPVEWSPRTTMKETLGAKNLNIQPDEAQTNVFKALAEQIRKQQGERAYLEAIDEMKKTGDLRPVTTAAPEAVEPGGKLQRAWDWTKSLTKEPAPRQIKVKGLEGFETHPKTADWLENSAYGSDLESRSLPEKVLSHINASRIGEMNKNFSNMWKSTVLGLHPGFHTGNVSSNLQMQYQKGMDALDMLPRAAQTARQQMGKGQDLLPGFDLHKEAGIRDVSGSGFFGGQSADIAATEGRGWIHKLGQYPPFKQIGEAQDLGTRFGGHLEDNAKEGLFIDYVLKNRPENLAAMSPEAQARFFDKAGRFAHSGMIDYGPRGGWTGWEKEVLPWAPFYKWSRGVAGATADTAINRPQKLSRLDRFQNQVFEGSDPEDRRAMPDYMREQAPIQGALGHTFEPDEAGERRLALLGRYLPQGNVEQAISRPLDYGASMVGPGPKTIAELLADYSMFKDRNIDDVVGFPGNLINPIIGGPYGRASRQIAGQTPPAAWEYALGQMPGGRYLNEANELGRAAGLWEDKFRKTQPTLAEWLTWYAAGGKTFPFDRERALEKRSRELDKQIRAIKYDISRGAKIEDEQWVETSTQRLDEALENKRLLLGR